MSAVLELTALALGVVWVVAVVGTALLRHASEQRRTPYWPVVPPSVVERASLVWLFQLGRALRAWRQWPLGLCYAVGLLAGYDAVLAIPEEDYRRTELERWESLRRESEQALRQAQREQAEEMEAVRKVLAKDKAERRKRRAPSARRRSRVVSKEDTHE